MELNGTSAEIHYFKPASDNLGPETHFSPCYSFKEWHLQDLANSNWHHFHLCYSTKKLCSYLDLMYFILGMHINVVITASYASLKGIDYLF